MHLEHMNAPIIVGWVLSLAAMAVSLNVSSATAWLLLVGVALLPPMMLLGIWRLPVRTMTESIREVLD